MSCSYAKLTGQQSASYVWDRVNHGRIRSSKLLFSSSYVMFQLESADVALWRVRNLGHDVRSLWASVSVRE